MQAKAPDLYELTGAYADAAAALMDCETDEDYAAALAQFDSIETAVSDKAESMARLLRNMQALHSMRKAAADAFALEAKRLAAKAKATENFIENIKDRVTFAMETAGMDKIRTGIGTWYVVEDVAVDVFAPEELPAEFLKQAEPTVDKVALKRYIKDSGEIVPGTNVTIRRGARFR